MRCRRTASIKWRPVKPNNMGSIFGKITSAKRIEIKDKTSGEVKSEKFMVDVFNPKTFGVTKAFLAPKVVAHAINGDSASAIEVADIKGKYISATYHAVGDMLIDDSEVTEENTILNNSTVSFISKADAVEIMSFQ